MEHGNYLNTPNNNKNNIFNLACIKEILSKSSDIKFQKVFINSGNEGKNLNAELVFVDGMVNIAYISDYILKPLSQDKKFGTAKDIDEIISLIESGLVYFPTRNKLTNLNEIINNILDGQAVLLFDQCSTAIIFDVTESQKRSVTETSSENILKGAKDSFVETLSVNTALVRNKIKSKQLIIEKITVGREADTSLALLYIENIAEDSLVNSIREKLVNIDIPYVNSVGVIEESIVDNPSSIFPQIAYTERVDSKNFR